MYYDVESDTDRAILFAIKIEAVDRAVKIQFCSYVYLKKVSYMNTPNPIAVCKI